MMRASIFIDILLWVNLQYIVSYVVNLSFLNPLGSRSQSENAEHGEVPPSWHGHGTPYGQEESKQLESTVPLVTVETAIWPQPR